MTGHRGEPFPASLVLAPDDVHVVWFSLAARIDRRDLSVLDAQERARADRIRDERHRARFVSAHATVRTVLGRSVGSVPGSLRFEYGPHGKPELAGAAVDARFNLAHAGDLGVVAVALGRPVGIDVEEVRPLDPLTLAREFLSTAEREALAARPAHEQLAAFHRCWVRKESFLKASGDGLTRELTAFDMSLDECGPPLLLACRDAPDDLRRWTTVDLPAEAGHVAALTTEGHGWRLVEWTTPGR